MLAQNHKSVLKPMFFFFLILINDFRGNFAIFGGKSQNPYQWNKYRQIHGLFFSAYGLAFRVFQFQELICFECLNVFGFDQQKQDFCTVSCHVVSQASVNSKQFQAETS